MLRWLALAALVTLVAASCVSAADAQQYDSSKDFNKTKLDTDNTHFRGIWSYGGTMWVADDDVTNKIFAYHLSNMSRYMNNDFTLHVNNTRPVGIWSDDTTMWVADNDGFTIYPYRMSDRMPDTTKKFGALYGNAVAGIWSDGTTMWVAERATNTIYAYNMSGTRDSNKDISLTAGNYQPGGIWSDGTTMWVADQSTGKIFAYNLATREPVPNKDFNTLDDVDNDAPYGIWSDGTTMWVADINAGKIYAYKMHPAPTAPTTSSPRVFVYVPPPDTTPPRVVSVERAGNATTTDHTLTWDVRFSESVRVGLKEIHTNYTSAVNATIPDLGMVHDTLLADVPGMATGGSISVDLQHPITSGLLIELVAPDCTKFVVHNQTTTFPYKLRQPYDLGDLSGVGAAGQWTLYVHDHAKYWNGTLNGWTLYLESKGVVEGSGRTHTITQYAAGPGEYALSLDGFDIRDRAGNYLRDADPAVNEPYRVVGAARTCQTE